MTSDVTIQTNRFQAEHKKYEKGGAIAWLLSLIVLLILIGVVVYAVYHRNWQADSDSGRREVNQAIASVKDASENAILTSKVKTALALSKHVSAFDINVDTNDGIVTLKGKNGQLSRNFSHPKVKLRIVGLGQESSRPTLA